MVYFTGDIHGVPWGVKRFCERMNLTDKDIVVLLGDVGANYYGDQRDASMKTILSHLAPTFFCIHGNHEMRPWHLDSYKLVEWNGGNVWVEEAYPNLIFAKDGEIFNLAGFNCISIGGAYSVDKYYRLHMGGAWWPDEQPSEEIKAFVERQLMNSKVEIVLSHTCPLKYEPTEMFLSGIDQGTVDDSTERWLDKVEEILDYKAWFCGHWHTDKRIDRMHFLFHSFESIEQFMEVRGG